MEHTEEGRTICEKISGVVVPEQIEKVLKKEVQKRTKTIEDMGLDNNRYFKILSVKEKISTLKEGYEIRVTIKRLNQEEKKICQKIFMTSYNSTGDEIRTESHQFSIGNEIGESGEVILYRIYPAES